jgi:hypothetical protein
VTITGLDQVRQLLDHLAQLPAQAEASAKGAARELRVSESTRGLFTSHRAGRHVAAVTFPARGKTAWISVIEPQAGTSRGGDRTRFASQEQALEHSREHTLEVAGKQADQLLEEEWERAEAEIDTLLRAL